MATESFASVAAGAALEAGRLLKRSLDRPLDVCMKTSERDLVTKLDREIELFIRGYLLARFPDHKFFGEETGAAGGAGTIPAEELESAEYVWIVDPIDGTTNVVHGFPFFAVSVALARRGEVVVGVVYDPVREELFAAQKGKGAHLGGRRLSVSNESSLSESLLASGFPHDPRALGWSAAAIGRLAPHVRNIRTGGSAALHLAYVAAGRLTGFFEPGLNPWDVAAGIALVREAGGRATALDGTPYRLTTRGVLATNGNVHGDLECVFRSLEPL